MPEDLHLLTATHWTTFGSGPRKAVGLHCSLAHSGAWSGVMGHLAGRITLRACDLPGHGRSADWDGVEDFTALCARVGATELDRPVDLIGHSGGAVAALQIAQAMPGRVRTLTLIEPVLFAAVRGTPAGRTHDRAMEPYAEALARGEKALAAERFTSVWGAGAPWATLSPRQQGYIADRIHLIAAGMPGLLDDTGGVLADGALEALEMPVMLISGGDAPPVIHAIAEAVAARLPDVGVAVVPGAGHMLPITHHMEVAGLIAANLDRALTAG